MNKRGGEELLIMLAQVILILTASAAILYGSSSISRGGDFKLSILETASKAEDIKSMMDQERRYATESAFFYTGGSGGFLQPSKCGIELLSNSIPQIPEDGAYYWKKQFETETSCTANDECVAVYGKGSYCYGNLCYKPVCTDIPTNESYVLTVRNFLNTYFSKADPRLCNLLSKEDGSIPTENCLNFENDLVEYEWDPDVTIELNDWRSWEIEFNFFPDKPELSVVKLAGGQRIIDYDYSTLVNLRMINDALRMLRFAQDYVNGSYGEREQSWINNELEQFIKTRYGTQIVGLLVCDNQAQRNCYPYFDWMTSFMSYFLVGSEDLPTCAKNTKDASGAWKYFNGAGKASNIMVELYNCFGDTAKNVNPSDEPSKMTIYSGADAVTCSQYCYDSMIDLVEKELTTMLTDHKVYYSFPSKLKTKTGYNWRGFMFDIGVDIKCEEILFRDPMTGRDCRSNTCGDYSDMICVSYDSYDGSVYTPINFDLSNNEYRYFTTKNSLTIRGNDDGAVRSINDGAVTSTPCNPDLCFTFNTGNLKAGENRFTILITDGAQSVESNLVVIKS